MKTEDREVAGGFLSSYIQVNAVIRTQSTGDPHPVSSCYVPYSVKTTAKGRSSAASVLRERMVIAYETTS